MSDHTLLVCDTVSPGMQVNMGICICVHVCARTLPYIEKRLSTFQCSWGYEPPTEMGIVSEVSSRPI